jgi:hypothetical protein
MSAATAADGAQLHALQHFACHTIMLGWARQA